ncbi:ATP-binding cassette sub-family C member 2-like [Amphiura filiformis]|uniref:ATP-binding cassette sub-family C member 2-like n=1 Tax=Amphiura filiformis TaxID=82378 RepID=UPI003B22407D
MKIPYFSSLTGHLQCLCDFDRVPPEWFCPDIYHLCGVFAKICVPSEPLPHRHCTEPSCKSCYSGIISIDGVPIDIIGLRRLRSELAIIPQDPVLFSGNIRFNLDPRSKKSNDEIWKALEMAQIKNFLDEDGLDFEVSEGGGT